MSSKTNNQKKVLILTHIRQFPCFLLCFLLPLNSAKQDSEYGLLVMTPEVFIQYTMKIMLIIRIVNLPHYLSKLLLQPLRFGYCKFRSLTHFAFHLINT